VAAAATSGNGCRTTCASLLNCANAASCAATILRTHNGGAPRSLNGVGGVQRRTSSTCDNYRVPPSCGVSLLVGEDGEEVQGFLGRGLRRRGRATPSDHRVDTDNALAIGLGVGIPLAVMCIVGVIVALVMMNRRTKFKVNEDVPAHAMVSARSERQGGNNAVLAVRQVVSDGGGSWRTTSTCATREQQRAAHRKPKYEFSKRREKCNWCAFRLTVESI
jgi:hypothetical protein